MDHANARSPRIACRIGPVLLIAEDAAHPIALAPAGRDAPASERALNDFAVPDNFREDPPEPNPPAAARLVLTVQRGRPRPRPDAAVVFRHRAGWDVYRRGSAMRALKAIPYGSDRILRSVEVNPEGSEAALCIAPEDDRPAFPFAYTLSELLILLLTRQSSALLVHSACVQRNGRALLFAGTSGTGKSTMAALWEKAGEGCVLGDESHLIWLDAQERLQISGTPWPGSSGLFSNRAAPLGQIFFLQHGRENTLRPLDEADAMVALLSHSFLPTWDAEALRAATDLSKRAAEQVAAAVLAFIPDRSVVEFLAARRPDA